MNKELLSSFDGIEDLELAIRNELLAPIFQDNYLPSYTSHFHYTTDTVETRGSREDGRMFNYERRLNEDNKRITMLLMRPRCSNNTVAFYTTRTRLLELNSDHAPIMLKTIERLVPKYNPNATIKRISFANEPVSYAPDGKPQLNYGEVVKKKEKSRDLEPAFSSIRFDDLPATMRVLREVDAPSEPIQRYVLSSTPSGSILGTARAVLNAGLGSRDRSSIEAAQGQLRLLYARASDGAERQYVNGAHERLVRHLRRLQTRSVAAPGDLTMTAVEELEYSDD